MNITVNEELKAYINPLTPDEHDALERSCLMDRFGSRQCNGCRYRSARNARSRPDIHPISLPINTGSSITRIVALANNQQRLLP